MSAPDIINVTPIEEARERTQSRTPEGSNPSNGDGTRPTEYANGAWRATTPPTGTASTEYHQAPKKQPSRLGGAVQVVAGAAIALVGVPMLILPGPGLLAIGGGVVLMARGAKNLFGRHEQPSC